MFSNEVLLLVVTLQLLWAAPAVSLASVAMKTKSFNRRQGGHGRCMLSSTSHAELQRDNGRGEMHLSAILEEGDIVVYQRGMWFVDGVEVGDGSTPSLGYCKIETIQLVWTHNSEHGVLRGFALEHESNESSLLHLTDEVIEFGPEQLLARIPVEGGTDGCIASSPSSYKVLCELRGSDWLMPLE